MPIDLVFHSDTSSMTHPSETQATLGDKYLITTYILFPCPGICVQKARGLRLAQELVWTYKIYLQVLNKHFAHSDFIIS